MHMIIRKQSFHLILTVVAFFMLGAIALQAEEAAAPQPLSPEEFQKVIKSNKQADWITIKALTDDQTKALINCKSIKVALGGVQEAWEVLWLNGVTTITDNQVKLLAENEVNLSLDGLTTLSVEQAKLMSRYKGKFIPRAFQDDPEYSRKFASRAAGVLSLNGLTTLDDETTKWLGKSKAFELDLNALKSISDLQAKSLGYFPGAILQMNSLKTLTDKQAKALAQFQGSLAVASLDKPSKDLIIKYGGVLIGQE